MRQSNRPRELRDAEDGIPAAALRPFREVGRFGTHYAEGSGRASRAIPIVVRILKKK